MRHMSIAVKRLIAGADGLPWWSPSQVLAAIHVSPHFVPLRAIDHPFHEVRLLACLLAC